ncbi:hypothetical protein TrVFT333_009580 [Trichoderma virens FT-333]|nr:hypothetical protein TrVFT333_009580 [Trichoderma virens FT-333]
MTASEVHSHRDYTIGWVCALRKEQTAATAMLDTIHDDLSNPPNDPNAYTLGSIGKHNIVIACLPEGKYGANAAATTVTWMASTFPSVKFGLMVGIGGGIPSNKVRLGDVVVSKPDSCFPGVIQWDLGKIEQGGTIEHTGSLNNPPTALLTSLAKLGTKREMEGSQIPNHLAAMGDKWPSLAAKYTRLESLRDTLFADDYPHIEGPITSDSAKGAQTYDTETDEEEGDVKDCRFCDITQARKRKPRTTRIHHGLIVSGNMVIKDAQFRNQLNEKFSSKVLCVEMEAAGLMNDFPCLVIRGICDYADSHKNKTWQEYAAAVAAAFAKELLLVVPVPAVEQMDPIASILSAIRIDLGLAVDYLVEARAHRHGQKHEKILEWLSPFDYGAEHSDVLKRRHPGTGQWLLDSAEFKQFIETNKQVLFCFGIPGAGKTVMTATVIDYLQKQFSNDTSICMAYVYFNFKRNSEQTPEAVFLSLLKQVIRQQLSLPESVKSLHETHSKNNTRPSLGEILEVFQEAVKLYSRVFIAIDALDECAALNDCREIMLSKIIACTEISNMKLFTTSRHIPEILDRFQSAIHLEIGATESDIHKYIDSRLSKLPPTSVISQSRIIQETIKVGISAAVNKMFLLAQLHFDRLTECITRKAVMKALKNLPTGSGSYDYAYSDAMNRINQQISSRSELAIHVLSWITHAKRPLSVIELQHALGVEIGEDTFDKENIPQVEDILSTTVGLVTIDEKSKIIRLVHYTTQEFFERTKKKWLPDAETYIADVCSTYLSYSAFEGEWDLTSDESEKRMKKYRLYPYAVANWKDHVTASHSIQHHVKFLRKDSNFNAYLEEFPSYCRFSPHIFIRYLPEYFTNLHLAAQSGWNMIVADLLRDFDDVDVYDHCNCTPFYLAASGGHSTVMETLLSSGQVNVNVISEQSNFTPLICAAQGGHVAAVKLLLGTGKVNAGFKCMNGKSALWYAVVGGHVDVVQLLLDERNYDKEMIREIHSSALLGAVIMENAIIVNLILEVGYADVNVQTTKSYSPFFWGPHPDNYCCFDTTWVYPERPMIWMNKYNGDNMRYSINLCKTPLCLALEFDCEYLVKLFLGMEGVDVHLKTEDPYAISALFLAAKRCNDKTFQILLDSGRFDINSRDELGQTPLMHAASNHNEGLVELLLSKGAIGIDWGDKRGRTSLYLAAENDSYGVAELLINTGKANINIASMAGDTPLFIATKRGHKRIVRLLLEAQGVDTNARDRRGRELLSLAAKRGDLYLVELCLNAGKYDVNARDNYGLTPLMLSAKNTVGSPGVTQLLLNAMNVDVYASDYQHGRTALLWAAYNGYLESFTALLQAGRFDINKRDVYGFTAFTIAAKERSTRIVEFLLNADGVDLHTRDFKDNRTALMWAAYSGCREVVALLLNSGKFDISEVDTNGFDSIKLAVRRGNRETIELLRMAQDILSTKARRVVWG